MKKSLTLSLFVLFFTHSMYAQFLNTPPDIQGNVGTGEYANNSFAGSPNGTWHIGWDDTYLYIAVITANYAENMVMYIDGNPISPVNGGSNTNGNLVGLADYPGYTPNLPFRADVRLFTNNANRGIWKSDGSGGWTVVHGYNEYGFSGITTSTDYAEFYYASYGDLGGNREMKIKWTDMGFSGRPVNFNFIGFMAASSSIYSLVPQENQPYPNNFDSYYSVVGSSNTTTSPFSILNHSQVLAVDIQYFEAFSKELQNLLTWVSASEKDNTIFNIQRSADNHTWQTIGSLKATNNSSGSQYNFTDTAPLNMINYYRLQIIDMNVKMAYSKVVSVNGKGGKPIFMVYPNPVKNELNLVSDSYTEGVSIYDLTGRLVRQLNGQSSKINIQDLSNGVYIARLLLKDGWSNETVRFVKQ